MATRKLESDKHQSRTSGFRLLINSPKHNEVTAMRGFRGGSFGLLGSVIAAAAIPFLTTSFAGFNPMSSERSRGIARARHPYRKLNRSQHWRTANSYQEARKLSPFPDRPVR